MDGLCVSLLTICHVVRLLLLLAYQSAILCNPFCCCCCCNFFFHCSVLLPHLTLCTFSLTCYSGVNLFLWCVRVLTVLFVVASLCSVLGYAWFIVGLSLRLLALLRSAVICEYVKDWVGGYSLRVVEVVVFN